jgi:cytidylate kinase
LDFHPRGQGGEGQGLKEKAHIRAPIITIDGPAGSGKSTVAKLVAKRLHLRYIDTGAMYRVATLISLKENIAPEKEYSLVEAVKAHQISFFNEGEVLKVLIDGEEVSDEIRTPELTRLIGPVCELPGIRRLLKEWQQKMGENGGVVAEGRDMGTVIFPQAEVKIYLTASLKERARRRWKELKEKGIDIDYQLVYQEISQRDERDIKRNEAPLKKADDAILIDTTNLSIDEVVEKVLVRVKKSRELNCA